MGLISDLKRKSLPAIAKAVGLENGQGLHHFISQSRLKEGDKYQTKPELGAEIVKELKEMGFKIKIKRVLADSLYGESDSNFISVVGELGIEYAVGIRSNHGVWLPKGQKVRANKWRAFKHISWDRKEETRYIREIIYGKRRTIQYWQITTDKETVRDDSTWFVMTKNPLISFNLILRWLKVFPVPQLSLGFPRLITKINEFDCLRYLVYCWDEFYCSSA